jgi:hypothetical protein
LISVPSLQKYETISFCYFTPFKLWYFVKEAPGNERNDCNNNMNRNITVLFFSVFCISNNCKCCICPNSLVLWYHFIDEEASRESQEKPDQNMQICLHVSKTNHLSRLQK